MNSYWFTYKIDKWPIEKLRELVARVQEGSLPVTEWWRVASSKSAQIGDRAYLFKQGAGGRGIFGTGEITDGPELRTDSDGDDGERFRVCIRFEKLVDPTKEFLLDLEELAGVVGDNLVESRSSGIGVPEATALALESLLTEKFPEAYLEFDASLCDDSEFDPAAIVDHRERALRAIRVRRGQAEFRQGLMAEYESRCSITGCAIVDVLEAAHISPHLGRLSNDLSNGLLLRTDIHTLFDCLLISVNPATRTIEISERLRPSSYKNLDKQKLRRPKNAARGPSKKALEFHFAAFKKHNSLIRS